MSLLAINIHNFTIIKHTELEFDNGLTVITGDTGAGKSIILDALSLLLGARGESDLIRHTQDKAELCAYFNIQLLPQVQSWLVKKGFIESNDNQAECIVRRVLKKDKPSRCYINDQATTLASLKELGLLLVDLHSQHEHQSLLRAKTQRSIVDNYASLTAALAKLKQDAQAIAELNHQLEQSQSQQKEANNRYDLLSFQLNELTELDTQENEFEALEQEYHRLHNCEAISLGLQSILDQTFYNDNQNISDQLNTQITQLTQLSQFDQSLLSPLELLNASLAQVSESKAEIESSLASIESNPERYQEVNQRLNSYITLSKKHGCRENELYEKQAALSLELDSLKKISSSPEALEQELCERKEHYLKQAKDISLKRQSFAEVLSKKITKKMQTLGLKGGEFNVLIEQESEVSFSYYGIDHIDFLVSTNAGMPLKPLTKTASGGELSRISLAIQMIANANTQTPILIFDEVDVGIGGNTAHTVGQCLKQLSRNTQVICITHQPQVASQANHHILVSKQQKENQTESQLSLLDHTQRTKEIARMLGDEQSSASILAQELLSNPN